MILARFIFVITILIVAIGITNAATLIDSFEDNDYTNNPTWTVSSGTWGTASDQAAIGTYSLKNKWKN